MLVYIKYHFSIVTFIFYTINATICTSIQVYGTCEKKYRVCCDIKSQ